VTARRPLVGLLAAVGISSVGTRMSLLAVPWFVLQLTGSPTATGVVAFAETAPYVLVQALGGPLVDRIGARSTSIAADAGAGIALAVVPVLHGLGLLPLALLTVLVALAGALRGGGDAARDVLVPGVAEQAGCPMERASGLYDGVSRLASLIGAPLGGVLVAATTPLAVLLVDAVSFGIASVLVLATVTRRAEPPPDGRALSPAAYLQSLREGFAFLRGDRLLLGIAVMCLLTNTLDQSYGGVLVPVWARQVAHSPVALGLIGGAFSIGAVLGNALLTWLGPRVPRRVTYGVGFLLCGAPRFVALAVAGSVTPVLPVLLLSGLGAGGINPVLGAVEYERVPRQLQVRVLGALGATAWAGIPIGSLAGGALATGVGLRPALWLVAGLYLLTTLAPFVFPAWRGMDREVRTPLREAQPSMSAPAL
jgi:MFS family permease